MTDTSFAARFGLTFHHLGYVVPDIQAGRATFAAFAAPGQDDMLFFEDHAQKVNVMFIRMISGPLIELVEPRSDDSPVTGFLHNTPAGGYHHIAFEAPDHEDACKAMRSAGFRKITPVTSGFEQRKIGFFLPRTGASAPLIELVSPPGEGT